LRSTASFRTASSPSPESTSSSSSIKGRHIPDVSVISLHMSLTSAKSILLIPLVSRHLLSVSSLFCRSVKFHVKIVLSSQCVPILSF
jgi:hypothetical protein